MASGVPEAFGFVPAHVVADLQDIGNWKSRATAIDLLHKALKDVSRPQNLVESLPDFVKFLVGLIADPNFKIAISSMSILGELAGKVGSALEPHLSVVVPALLEKFTDSKILVRAANMKAIKKLMGATSPGGVLELLALGSSHTSWRVREEVLNTHIMAMLSFGSSAYGLAAVYSLMRAGMADGKDKVRLVALEGMAVLGAKAGRAELTALMVGQKPGAQPLPEEHRREVVSRLSNAALPSINGDGLVEHCVELPAASGAEAADLRLADAAFGGAGGTKLPWGDPSTPPRPRLRTAASSDHPGSSSANGRERPAGPGGGGAEGGPPAGRRQASALNLDNIRSGPSIVFQHGGLGGGVEAGGESGLWSPSYRPVPVPGPMLGHPPSRLGSHESFTAGAAYGGGGAGAGGGGGGGGGYPISAASGWSLSAARPPPLHVIERPASPLREAVSGGQLPAVSHPLLSLASESSQERNSAGSAPPHARDLHGGAHTPNALQPLKHHWGATRSIEGQPAALKNPLESSEESPLSPAARNFQPLVSSRGSAPGVAPSEMMAAAAASHHHHGHMRGDGLEYIQRPASVRTQAAAELRESRDPRAPPTHSLSHPPLGAGGSVATAPGGSGGGGAPHSSSSMAMWLHQNGIDDHTASRQETFSPSKAEMLARLKVRQIEKRAATAQMDPPPGSHGDLLLSSANDIAPIAASSHASITGGVPPGRRHLFTQLSDNQRDRGGGAGAGGADRGYNSVLNTPTRAGGVPPSPFDEAPASARPPRTGLAARLGRATPMAVDPSSGAASSRSPTLASPGFYASPSPAASEDSPARPLAPASPALNRLRARSAEVSNLYPPNTPGGGPGPGAMPATPGGSGGSFWEKRSGADVTTEELAPLQDPEKHIRVVISKLIEANNADRKELDWQGQYEALIDARRLVRHHTEVVRGCLHEFVRAATPAIDQLRSQTSKCALTLFQECFVLLGRAMDRELDEMVPVLVKKAGEVSNAGRDNFLAEAADRTLAEMCRCCGEARCTAALLGVAGHKNPYVRGKVAYHLDCHMEACAGGARPSLANNPSVVERVFKAGAAFLDEGGLDSRTYGKRIIWHVKAMLASRAEFDRLVHSVTPESLHRKVVDTVEGLNGPPPPPSRAVAGGVPGSRLASRQLGPGGAPASPMRPILDGAMGGGGGGGGVLGGGGGSAGAGGGMGGSLTQNPPPMRQSSYSAPSPLGAGAGGATPERRRGLGRQRTSDLDGIPEGSGSGNTSGNGRMPPRSAAAGSLSARGSSGSGGGGGPSGDGGGGGFGPAVQETVVKSLLMLTAKDFRERIEALRAVEGVVGSLPGAPDSLLIQLLDALVARLGDANAKVSMAALELVGQLAGALRSRISLSLNTLVPALAATLGAANDKIRGAALAATDALLATLDPAMLVQHFSHVVGNGTIQRGKPLLVDKLVAIAGALYPAKPQLVARYAVPAAFALLNDSKGGEAKAAANALLSALARMMGPALLEQAGGLNAVAQQRVADAVAVASGQAPAGGPELRRGGSFKDREVGGGGAADRPWAPRR